MRCVLNGNVIGAVGEDGAVVVDVREVDVDGGEAVYSTAASSGLWHQFYSADLNTVSITAEEMHEQGLTAAKYILLREKWLSDRLYCLVKSGKYIP